MGTTTSGPSWQSVATACATILFSIAVGAGGYFVAQQAVKDQRQDQLLDAVATKLVDISINMVTIKAGQEEMKVTQAKEITLREERDRRELDEYRQRQAAMSSKEGGKR